jgi:glucan phosphorylase
MVRRVSNPINDLLPFEIEGFTELADLALDVRRSLNEAASPLNQVAFFTMEFMLAEAFSIYSGGLGNVAGEPLKAALDLGAPVIGISLLYQQGYFRQMIDQAGRQQALFPYNDPGQMPMTPVREANGEWLRLALDFPGFPVTLRAWQVQGRTNPAVPPRQQRPDEPAGAARNYRRALRGRSRLAYLAIRGSGRVNVVSRFHGHVSRRLFAPLFPCWPIGEVPVGYVTNGVHVPSWESAEADALWRETGSTGSGERAPRDSNTIRLREESFTRKGRSGPCGIDG